MTIFGTNLPHGPFRLESGRNKIERLFHSEESRGWIHNCTLAPGFGQIPQGTLLAENNSVLATGYKGRFVPYVPPDYTNVTTDPYKHIGRTFVVADVAAEATTLKIKNEDQYRFKVGDDLILDDDTETPEFLGAITDITAGTVSTTITFTNAVTATQFAVSDYANVYVNSAYAPVDLAADLSNADETLTVALADDDNFHFGDTLIVCAPGTAIQNLGTILSVTPGSTTTTIKFSTAVSGANFTTANDSIVYALNGAMSVPLGVLTRDRDTGTGEFATHQIPAPILYHHGELYESTMHNLDANAKKVLGMTVANSIVMFP